jgi:hypothetical protein
MSVAPDDPRLSPAPKATQPDRDPHLVTGNASLPPPTNAEIIWFQTMLKDLGYYRGPIDGIWGSQSEAAARAFQQKNGLTVTGTLDYNTRDALTKQVQSAEHQARSSGGTAPAPTGPAPAGGGGGGGGGSGAPASASNTDVEKQIREMFPQWAIYLDHPELGPILRDAATRGVSPNELAGMIYQTNWWKTTSSTARAFDHQVVTDNATAAQRIMQQIEKITMSARRMGYHIDPNWAYATAVTSLRFGWDEVMLNRAIVGEIRSTVGASGFLPGSLAATADQLMSYSGDYFVPISQGTAQQWALDIAEGIATEDGFRSWVVAQARGRFPWLNAYFDQGITPGRYFSSHQQTIAGILQISPDDVNLMDRKWSSVIDYTDDKGVRRAMTLGEVEDWARKLPEYAITDQANAKGHEFLQGFLSDMGVMA